MGQELLATARIELSYVVNGLAHKLRHYCTIVYVLGQPQVADRDGLNTLIWDAGVAQFWWNRVRGMLENGAVQGTAQAQLQSRSGTIWNPIAYATLSGGGAGNASTKSASQATFVLRDTAFKKIRAMILEHTEGYVFHSLDGTGGSSATLVWANAYTGADTDGNAMYRWVKSRGDRFILGRGSAAGLTFDLNDKLKRARGLA
jgi:hypothetical protein